MSELRKEHRYCSYERRFEDALKTRQQYISQNTKGEDHPRAVGDFKELPLMKGIERMMREKVTGDGARLSACTGDLQGVRVRVPRKHGENGGESKCQDEILSLAVELKSKLPRIPCGVVRFLTANSSGLFLGQRRATRSYGEEFDFLTAGSEVRFT